MAAGIMLIALGATIIIDGGELLGVATVAFGSATIAVGIAIIGPDAIGTRIQLLVDMITKVPPETEGKEAQS